MTDYKATFEQWNDVERCANSGSHASTDHCILELLSRIENVEEEQDEDHKTMLACFDALIKRIEKLENNSRTTPNYVQIRSSLVRKVQRAIDKEYEESLGTGENEAKAAISAVADWLWGEFWPEAAQELEEEIKK